MALLDNIKTELGISDTSKDDLLSLLITNEQTNAQTITHNEDVAEDEVLIQRMVIWRYNTLGSEGLTAENYSGVSYSYTADYPADIDRLLKSHRKIRVIKNAQS